MKQLPFWKRPYFAHRVLDIGAGHNPYKGVTHVVDLDVEEGKHRGGTKMVVPKSARLIVGEATGLPFRTGTFEYIYASHVLEHVHDPESACSELMRVGAAGYIETPSPLREQGSALLDRTPPEDWDHKWFIFPLDERRLVFEPKNRDTVFQFCSCPDGQFMREFYHQVEFPEAERYLSRRSLTTAFFWTSRFELEVRSHTVDCKTEGRPCRFRGMKRMLIANCNDLLRAARVRRLKKRFPGCTEAFRRFGHRTLLIH